MLFMIKLLMTHYFITKLESEYLDNSIFLENLDIKFSEKKSTMYNDVVFKNSN